MEGLKRRQRGLSQEELAAQELLAVSFVPVERLTRTVDSPQPGRFKTRSAKAKRMEVERALY